MKSKTIVLALLFATFGFAFADRFDVNSFVEGYKAGYNDAIDRISSQVKAICSLRKTTKILEELLLNPKAKKYFLVYKTKSGKEYYLFIPADYRDFPELTRIAVEAKQRAMFVPGYYVYIPVETVPIELLGLMKFLAEQKGYEPFFKGKLLVFNIDATEASAQRDVRVLKELFSKYLKNFPEPNYKYLSPKSNDLELLMQVENF